MPDTSTNGAVHVGATADGTVTYLVDVPPEALPPVRGRDLAAAWEAAREAAGAALWGTARLFRFRRIDGGFTDLAISDTDALCWAGAVDDIADMRTSYGLSLCLRLLALVDLLAHAPWATALFSLPRGGAALHPALLRIAATVPLTQEARFDEADFRLSLSRLPGTIAAPRGAIA